LTKIAARLQSLALVPRVYLPQWLNNNLDLVSVIGTIASQTYVQGELRLTGQRFSITQLLLR